MSARPTPAASLASRISAPLEQARLRYAGSDLQQFLQWWGGELVSLLPATWRALFAQGRSRVLYVSAGDALELRVEEGGRSVAVSTVTMEDGVEPGSTSGLRARVDARLGAARVERPRWLLLPAGQVLRRLITLPAAATDRLRSVVAHELDRQTPFRADQVTYDCRVLAIDPATRMAQVELLVLPKDRLESALAALGPLASDLSGVDALDAQGVPLRCNLLPVERRQASDHRRLWLNLSLGAISLIAVGFALGQILDNRRNEVDRLQAEVDRRHEQAHLVGVLTKQLDDALDGTKFLDTRRAAEPSMLAILADISARIPDNTFLERFSQQQDQIYLTGLSSDAPGLVAKLQASPMLRAPALSGSLQPDAAAKRDRFTLAANLNVPKAASATTAKASSQGGDDAPSP